jgi:uncharacterized protein (TIGR02145 family)
MDNEKGKSIISTGSSNLAKIEKLLSITQKILSEIKPQYESVRIGNQEWMTRNLDVDRFRNGDLIPHVKSVEEWRKAGHNGQPAWCYYKNYPENGKKYGKLYNWFAVADSRGLAPLGWHIPSDDEWTSLVDFMGGEYIAGHKLKSVEGWACEDKDGELQNGNGDNSSGFNVLPGGCRGNGGSFHSISYNAFFWSATEYGNNVAWYRCLYYGNGNVYRYYGIYFKKSVGASVRCLRDNYLSI